MAVSFLNSKSTLLVKQSLCSEKSSSSQPVVAVLTSLKHIFPISKMKQFEWDTNTYACKATKSTKPVMINFLNNYTISAQTLFFYNNEVTNA